jgi:hypothetical protein
MSRHLLAVTFDGVLHPVSLHGRHWLPRVFGFDGVAIGRTVYLRLDVAETSRRLIGHELVHVLDFVRRWRRWRWYWLAVVLDIAQYLVAWVRAGFRYHAIPEEVSAYTEQSAVMLGTHPHITVQSWRMTHD